MSSSSGIETYQAPTGERAKSLGAYYTDARVADFLVWWAIRTSGDSVLDPSFGGGVFLRSACQRLATLGGDPATQVFGVEFDLATHAATTEVLHGEFGVRRANLIRSDFFEVDSKPLRNVDAVVGNPPFVRYQRFTGEARRRALAASANHGVALPGLSSSWAPFLVHSAATLREAGRLAMVAPMELLQAGYGLPVLGFLAQSFRNLYLLTFRKKLFPHLSEETILVLAEGRGAGASRARWRDLPSADALESIQRSASWSIPGVRLLNTTLLVSSRERFAQHFLPRVARDLYRHLRAHPLVRRLGETADVGIGYVTGANDFFHLSPSEATLKGIPKELLRPAVRRARAFVGLRFTREDWHKACGRGDGGCLLSLPASGELPEPVSRYLRHGEANGVSKAYKCRSRSPWYRVPHVFVPDAFLSYMSGATPRLVANDAKAVAPNTLHVVRLHPLSGIHKNGLAALWQTSLTRLSAEIEGHSLGGGMLKLEPTEAGSVLLAAGNTDSEESTALAAEMDSLLRRGDEKTAVELADQVVLRKRLGLSRRDCETLREAIETLRQRRNGRTGRR